MVIIARLCRFAPSGRVWRTRSALRAGLRRAAVFPAGDAAARAIPRGARAGWARTICAARRPSPRRRVHCRRCRRPCRPAGRTRGLGAHGLRRAPAFAAPPCSLPGCRRPRRPVGYTRGLGAHGLRRAPAFAAPPCSLSAMPPPVPSRGAHARVGRARSAPRAGLRRAAVFTAGDAAARAVPRGARAGWARTVCAARRLSPRRRVPCRDAAAHAVPWGARAGWARTICAARRPSPCRRVRCRRCRRLPAVRMPRCGKCPRGTRPQRKEKDARSGIFPRTPVRPGRLAISKYLI